jgi:hypothetical protein
MLPMARTRTDRSRLQRALAVTLLLCCAPWADAAAAPFTAGKPVKFSPGNPKARAMLSRIADLREIVAERFGVAMVDLNGDGRAEIIVQSESSGFCGSGGCTTVVVEQQGKRMVTLLTQNLFPGLVVTNEKVGAYHALAASDDKGGIAIADKKGTPLHGKQMVYPMAGQPLAARQGRVR